MPKSSTFSITLLAVSFVMFFGAAVAQAQQECPAGFDYCYALECSPSHTGCLTQTDPTGTPFCCCGSDVSKKYCSGGGCNQCNGDKGTTTYYYVAAPVLLIVLALVVLWLRRRRRG